VRTARRQAEADTRVAAAGSPTFEIAAERYIEFYRELRAQGVGPRALEFLNPLAREGAGVQRYGKQAAESDVDHPRTACRCVEIINELRKTGTCDIILPRRRRPAAQLGDSSKGVS
jgi:hypothetical protein